MFVMFLLTHSSIPSIVAYMKWQDEKVCSEGDELFCSTESECIDFSGESSSDGTCMRALPCGMKVESVWLCVGLHHPFLPYLVGDQATPKLELLGSRSLQAYVSQPFDRCSRVEDDQICDE
jgi:hypothetical protein